jgi:ribose transport system permease protein
MSTHSAAKQTGAKTRAWPLAWARARMGSLTGVILILVLIIIVSSLISPYFLTAYNLTIIMRTLAFVGLVTIAQASLMLLGELDLSLGAIGGLTAVIAGIMMVNFGVPPVLAIVACLAIGVVCGLINGLLVALLRLHSLVLTIGMAGIYGGINLVLTQGVAITGIPDSITFIGRGSLGSLPMPLVALLILLAVVSFVMLRTPLGRYVYAIGNNRDAARMLGIRVDRVRICAFAFAGFVAGLAGVLMVARLGTAQPSIGEDWVLPPIAAAVIGGVATTGGTGSPLGAILGAVIIGVIENIIVLLGVSPYWQSIVSGAIVVAAISVDSLSKHRLGRSP